MYSNSTNGRLNLNGNYHDNNNNGYASGMALVSRISNMKTHKNLYSQIYEWKNLVFAYKKARKGKTKMPYVIEFEKDLRKNLQQLQFELMTMTYSPMPLQRFVIKDPKIRVINSSDFRDRIIHHALINIIGEIFERSFIYDSCANQKGKGNLFAIKRFEKFMRKVSRNGEINGWFNNNQVKGYCLKADVKHYFNEISHSILIRIIKRKIKCKKTIWLIKKILANALRPERERETRACVFIKQIKECP